MKSSSKSKIFIEGESVLYKVRKSRLFYNSDYDSLHFFDMK